MRFIYAALLLCLLHASALKAQDKNHSIGVTLNGGIQSLSYDPAEGSHSSGTGFGIELRYRWMMSGHWGLYSGAGMQFYRASATLDKTTSTPSVDSDGDDYFYNVIYNGWTEKQELMALEIPIGFIYKAPFGKNSSLMLGAGASVAIPVSADYRSSGGHFATEGYYPQYGLNLSDLPQHGFSKDNGSKSGTLATEISYNLNFDIGLSHRISPSAEIYYGAYGTIGLTDIRGESGNQLFSDKGVYSGMLSSDICNKATQQAFGVKLGINFAMSSGSVKQRRNRRLEKVTEPEAVAVDEVEPQPDMIVEIAEEPEPIEPEPSAASLIVVEEHNDDQPIDYEAESKEVLLQIQSSRTPYYRQLEEFVMEYKLYFRHNSIRNMYKEYRNLIRIVHLLNFNPEVKMIISGYACSDHEERDITNLSIDRADHVRDRLIHYGAPANRLKAEGRGSQSIVSDEKELMYKNRRVEFIIE